MRIKNKKVLSLFLLLILCPALSGCRVRTGSVEPTSAALDLIDAMAENENICRYLHLPIQSGSNMILSAMHRPYSMKTVDEVVHKALTRMPLLAIGSDLMVGFPGEGELEYIATLSVFRRIPIARAHIFSYSERPGTVAATLPNEVPREIRHERAQELAEVADLERTRYAKKMVGHDVEIVVEDEDAVAGWTSEYFWCRAQHDLAKRFRPKRRERVKMRVTKAEGHMLIGS